MKPAVRNYLLQFGGAMGAYAGTLIGSVILLKNNEFGTALTAGLALLPVIPVLLGLRAVFTFYRSMDEFQRRVISEAMIASALITAFSSFAYGFLEGALDLPVISMIWVMPVMIGLYGLIAAFLKWRYR